MHWILQDALWLAPVVLEIAVASAVFYRGAWKVYPIFSGYLIAEIVRAGVLFGIGSDIAHYASYFYTYWVSECFVCLVGFFVVAEVFRSAFAKRVGLDHWGSLLFRASLLVLIAVAILQAGKAPGSDANRLMAGILVLKRAESLVRLGLIIALFLFVLVLGLSWTNRAIGIAAGFAFYGVLEFLALTFRTHFGHSANGLLKWSSTIAALCQQLIWVAYFVSGTDVACSKARSSPAEENSVLVALEKMKSALAIAVRR